VPADALGSLPKRLGDEYRYGSVLALLAVLVSFALAAPEGAWSRLAIVVLQALILLTAAWAGNARRGVRRAARLVAAVAALGALAGGLGAGTVVEDVTAAGAVLLVLLTPAVMLGGLARALREQGVTPQVIIGAVAIYLLLGTVCAGVYGVLERLSDGPLFAGASSGGTTADRYYFSFITQATVGYGDFTPQLAAARAVAVSQAIAGQLYLVTVVALLVGRLGSRPPRDRGHERG
jgi:hypothetical protein